MFPVIEVTPPSGIPVGPFTIGFYGLGYAVAIAAGFWLAGREAAARGMDRRVVVDALLLIVVFAVIGGRLYHVIDEWDYYRDRLLQIVLPPYSGLGLYGGIAAGVLAVFIFTRRRRIPFLRWADVGVAGLLLGQSIARWGNFFNQELYGSPTDLPWGITIECEHRVPIYPCQATGGAPAYPFESTGFHPLFFYESALNLLGALVALWLPRRFAGRLRDGDLVSFWLIWYGSVRTLLEPLRQGYNWTVAGVPTAMLIGVIVVVVGLVSIRLRRTDRFSTPIAPAPGRPAATGLAADASDVPPREAPEPVAADAPLPVESTTPREATRADESAPSA